MSLQMPPFTDSRPDMVKTWGTLALQVTDINSVIVISDEEFQRWSEHEKSHILSQYLNLTELNGMFVRDSAIPRIFLGPTVYFEQKLIFHIAGQLPVLFYDFSDPNYQFAVNGVEGLNNVTTAAASNKVNNLTARPEKIPRPPNAFILYRKHHHPAIVAKNPGIHNNEVSAIIGKMWNSEKPDVLAEWKSKAEKVKEDHARKHPGYQYQPRRPSEKKRRRSRKKLETQASPKNNAPSLPPVSPDHDVPSSPSLNIPNIAGSLPPTPPAPETAHPQDIFSEIEASLQLPGNMDLSLVYQAVEEADRQIESHPEYLARMDDIFDGLEVARLPGIIDFRNDLHDFVNDMETQVLAFPRQLLNQMEANTSPK